MPRDGAQNDAAADVASICGAIRFHHRRRQFAMGQRKAMDNQSAAYLRLVIGWHAYLPKDESEALKGRVQTAIAAVESELKLALWTERKDKGERVGRKPEVVPFDDADLLPQYDLVVTTLKARSVFDKIEADATKQMESLAALLPVAEWTGEVRGLGMLGLAQIVAEAGNLSDYANPAKLWKRMGVGVIDGVRQGGLRKGADKADWIAHGYNRMRRSVMWNIGQCFLKAGGPYRELIDERKIKERAKAEAAGLKVLPSAKIKACERDKCMSDGHVLNRARRYAEKRLLRDLWRVWRRGAKPDMSPTV